MHWSQAFSGDLWHHSSALCGMFLLLSPSLHLSSCTWWQRLSLLLLPIIKFHYLRKHPSSKYPSPLAFLWPAVSWWGRIKSLCDLPSHVPSVGLSASQTWPVTYSARMDITTLFPCGTCRVFRQRFIMLLTDGNLKAQTLALRPGLTCQPLLQQMTSQLLSQSTSWFQPTTDRDRSDLPATFVALSLLLAHKNLKKSWLSLSQHSHPSPSCGLQADQTRHLMFLFQHNMTGISGSLPAPRSHTV